MTKTKHVTIKRPRYEGSIDRELFEIGQLELSCCDAPETRPNTRAQSFVRILFLLLILGWLEATWALGDVGVAAPHPSIFTPSNGQEQIFVHFISSPTQSPSHSITADGTTTQIDSQPPLAAPATVSPASMVDAATPSPSTFHLNEPGGTSLVNIFIRSILKQENQQKHANHTGSVLNRTTGGQFMNGNHGLEQPPASTPWTNTPKLWDPWSKTGTTKHWLPQYPKTPVTPPLKVTKSNGWWSKSNGYPPIK